MKTGWKIACSMAGAALTVALLKGFVATTYLIPSSGMENTLYRGERILVNKWKYGLRLPCMTLTGYHRWRPQEAGLNDIVVFNNPANFNEPVIDRREVFIGRCIGTPGDTLMVDSLFYADPSEQYAPDRKSLYAYPAEREAELNALMKRLNINNGPLMGNDTARHIRSFSRYEHYLLEQATGEPCWIQPLNTAGSTQKRRPLIIPQQGAVINIYPWNLTLLRNTILLHEHKQADIKGDTLYVDGKAVKQYRFDKDYYWVVSNNSVNLSGSQVFGLVPHDHLIGKAALIWWSKRTETGPFNGYRWERVGMKIE